MTPIVQCGHALRATEGDLMEKRYFEYGDEEIAYLKAKDKRLAEVIERIGFIEREVHADVFQLQLLSVVH